MDGSQTFVSVSLTALESETAVSSVSRTTSSSADSDGLAFLQQREGKRERTIVINNKLCLLRKHFISRDLSYSLSITFRRVLVLIPLPCHLRRFRFFRRFWFFLGFRLLRLLRFSRLSRRSRLSTLVPFLLHISGRRFHVFRIRNTVYNVTTIARSDFIV